MPHPMGPMHEMGDAVYVERDDLEAPARRAFAASEGRRGDWMQTAHARKFWVMDPRPDEVHIDDIGWQLALICRYNGCCGLDEPWHYSVAQHSVLVSRVLEARGYVRATQLDGLLHDAPEAYCCDIHRPLKRNLREYGPIEHRIWLAVAAKFGLSLELDSVVKEADNDVLLAEQAQIMKPAPAPWSVPGTAAQILVEEITPKQAYRMFMERFRELTT
jgi:hypothetical protein